MNNRYRIGFSNSTLKIIAVLSMVIDHLGLGIWYRLPSLGYLVPEMIDMETWWSIFQLMRNIGRPAFPIFCFLLVEGFSHTSSYFKYAVRLFIFSLISQLPFHYAFLNLAEGLNVFFTLLIGLMALWGFHEVKTRWPKRIIYLPSWALIAALACFIADFLNTDYDYKGVLLIICLYIFRQSRIIALISSYFTFKFVMYKSASMTTGFLAYLGADYCFPGFILSYFYNGKRGLKFKYLFYLVYPVHLMLIYLAWNYLL
ncbi:MAG: conjugal transfer protein TraX [Lachnospiraceae bacterium]|nr:conjugal transfer protein TraX [Lachnospiraceae bacterium]